MRAEDGADAPELRAGTPLSPSEHVARLDRLIAEQADELARLQTILLEVTAVCDLAEWANEAGPAVVLVDDLRRILPQPAADPVPPGS